MIHHRYKMAACLMALITLADQMTKWWVVNKTLATPGHPVEVTSFFNIVMVHNKGMTFGMLSTLNKEWVSYGLVVVATVILGLLGRWLWRTTSTVVAISLAAIMGGAIGNVIDRLRYGWVVDFLDFYVQAYHWPAFNVADACIVTGVAFLFLDSLVRAR